MKAKIYLNQKIKVQSNLSIELYLMQLRGYIVLAVDCHRFSHFGDFLLQLVPKVFCISKFLSQIVMIYLINLLCSGSL